MIGQRPDGRVLALARHPVAVAADRDPAEDARDRVRRMLDALDGCRATCDRLEEDREPRELELAATGR